MAAPNIESSTANKGVLTGAGGAQVGATSSDLVGFYGTSPVAKATITGTRDDGIALASLLDALEAMGLIVDSTTAT